MIALHFFAEGNISFGGLHTGRTRSWGAWALCGLFCVALAPSSAQAARSKQEGTACTELSYRDAGSHPNTEDLIPVIMQPHLVAFFFLNGVTDLLCQVEKAEGNICRDAEGVSHAEPGG